MDTHKFVVHETSNKIHTFHTQRQPFTIHRGHGQSHSSWPPPDPRAVIHTGHLIHILDINKPSRFAMVEPNVTMDVLVKEALKQGLMPPVVPSFPGLTVGGCFAGTAGSSASFRHGFFDRAVMWVEVVLPDGTMTRASRTKNPELLEAMVGTLGSIGVATLFQIKLVPAQRYVELRYLPVKTAREALDTIEDLTQGTEEHDFVEGLIYGPEECVYGVVVVGKLSKVKEYPLVTFSKPSNEWFYQHALTAARLGKIETVPTTEYLFRYDRGMGWMGRYAFGKVAFNRWTRWITDCATRSQALMKTMHELEWSDHFIQQDVVVPLEKSAEMVGMLEEGGGIYPMLVCPVRQWVGERHLMRPNPLNATHSLTISIRGYTPETLHNPVRFAKKHRQIEHGVQRLGGFKWLHSKNFYTEEQFWSVYDREKYEAVRKKYGAEYLQNVFAKSRVSEEDEIRGKRMRETGGIRLWSRIFERTSILAVREKEDKQTGEK
ncbi:hypothetical protein CC80DRAFT_59297 [Byssothecium circinans]|uniref:Delta(24)-sterol reductase n=1 Tax=Byssothecium circinans TaxID=147558 RepID=A0A6A5TXZ0_9PLEO|nr:hypothetical protein CC80DRAFT_59297 [Byssothecium circinans]